MYSQNKEQLNKKTLVWYVTVKREGKEPVLLVKSLRY